MPKEIYITHAYTSILRVKLATYMNPSYAIFVNKVCSRSSNDETYI